MLRNEIRERCIDVYVNCNQSVRRRLIYDEEVHCSNDHITQNGGILQDATMVDYVNNKAVYISILYYPSYITLYKYKQDYD